MKVSQTNPAATFSAINMVIPVSIPIASVSYQPFKGLNAFTKPVAASSIRDIVFSCFLTRVEFCGRNGDSEPACVLGTTLPSMGPICGGPPQTTYPVAESEAVIPQQGMWFGVVAQMGPIDGSVVPSAPAGSLPFLPQRTVACSKT